VAAGKTTVMNSPVVLERALVAGTFTVEKFVQSFGVLVEAAGGIAKLRKLVLALALQGRLSNQIASNDSASDGLDDVVHDTSWRVEERPPKTKLDPKIEALAGVVPVPSGWVECRLNDCAQLINGRAYAQHELLSEGTPVIRIQNLNGGSDWYYSDLTLPDRQYCQNGDLLFAWSASFGPYIWSGPRAIYHYHIWKLNLSKSIDKRFFFFSLLHITDVVKEQSHGLAMLHMTKGQMERWPILLPPLAEQKRIVARVEQLMALIDQLEAKQNRKREVGARFTQASLEALTTAESPQEFTAAWTRIQSAWPTLLDHPDKVAEVRKAVVRVALRGRLIQGMPASGSTSLDGIPAIPPWEIPAHWGCRTAEDVCEFITKGTTPSPTAMTSLKGDVPFLKVYNLTFGGPVDFSVKPTFVSFTTHENALARSKVLPGDVLMNIVGPPLGKVSIVSNAFPEWNINQAIARFRVKPGLAPQFLAMCLLDIAYLMSSVAADYRGTAGQDNISLAQCRSLPIPLPPEAEQKSIVAKVEQLMKLCAALEAALRRSEDRAAKLVEAVVQEMVA
jgi:type I restriction enzyme S subunit